MMHYMIEHLEKVNKLPNVGKANVGYCIEDSDTVKLYLYENNKYINISTINVSEWGKEENNND